MTPYEYVLHQTTQPPLSSIHPSHKLEIVDSANHGTPNTGAIVEHKDIKTEVSLKRKYKRFNQQELYRFRGDHLHQFHRFLMSWSCKRLCENVCYILFRCDVGEVDRSSFLLWRHLTSMCFVFALTTPLLINFSAPLCCRV